MIPPDKLDHEALEVDDRDKLRDGRTCIVNATVTAVTFCENTVDLLLEDSSEVNGVPVFYHCQGVKTAKGGIMAFEENDEVLLYREYEGDGDLVDQYVIGFQDKPHYCNKYLLVILVGSSSYGYSNVKVIVWDVLASDFGAIEVNDKLINNWPIPYNDEDFQDWLDLPAVTYLGQGYQRGGSQPSSSSTTGQFANQIPILDDAPWYATSEDFPVCAGTYDFNVSDSGDGCDLFGSYYCSPQGASCLRTIDVDEDKTLYIKRTWIDPYTMERFTNFVFIRDGSACLNNFTHDHQSNLLYECVFTYPEDGWKRIETWQSDNVSVSYKNCMNSYTKSLGSSAWYFLSVPVTTYSYDEDGGHPWDLYMGISSWGPYIGVCTINYINTGDMTETYLGDYGDIPMYSREQNEDPEFTHIAQLSWSCDQVNHACVPAYCEGDEPGASGSVSLHTTITHKRFGTIYDFTSTCTGGVTSNGPFQYYDYSPVYNVTSSSLMHAGSYYSNKLTFNQIGCDISFWLVGVGYTAIQYNCNVTCDEKVQYPSGFSANTVVNRTSRTVNSWFAIEDTRNGESGYTDYSALANMIAAVGKEVWDATIPLANDLAQGGYPYTYQTAHDNVNFVATLKLYKQFSY